VLGQRSSKNVHLIEAAFAGALPVKRHRYNNVGGKALGIVPNQFGEPMGKPCAQRLNLFMLQKENRAGQAPFVRSITARKLKPEPVLLAIGAERHLLGKFRVECARQPASRAVPRGDFLKGSEAIVADGKAARTREQLIANPAARGEEHASECTWEISQPVEQISVRRSSTHGGSRQMLPAASILQSATLEIINISGWMLEQTLFHLFLAGDAVFGPRHGFQALLLHLFVADGAVAVVIAPNAL